MVIAVKIKYMLTMQKKNDGIFVWILEEVKAAIGLELFVSTGQRTLMAQNKPVELVQSLLNWPT